MCNPGRCCDNEILYFVIYKINTAYKVCSTHWKMFEFQTGVSKIFDYKTKKEMKKIPYD